LLLPTFSTNKGMTSISTFDITKEPLLDLLRDIQQGKIQLVDFQRSWCWDEERIERVIAGNC
jgi:hypothetical protein